jgi:Restriction endonuclease XhoI
MTESLIEHGVDESWIQVGRRAMLPGAYGLGRFAWDLAVLKDDVPLGTISFKPQAGSIGKNFNNRWVRTKSVSRRFTARRS